MNDEARLYSEADVDGKLRRGDDPLPGLYTGLRHRLQGQAGHQGFVGSELLGDATRHNPEDMLLASLSACHMLWYLHLCAVNKIVVTAYEDQPEGAMEVVSGSDGRFTEVVLRPRVTIAAGSDAARAESLHEVANSKCFVANSVNFPVEHEVVVTVA